MRTLYIQSRNTGMAALMLLAGQHLFAAQPDLSKAAIVRPFETTIKGPASAALPEATRSAVILYLKDSGIFQNVLTPEDRKSVV